MSKLILDPKELRLTVDPEPVRIMAPKQINFTCYEVVAGSPESATLDQQLDTTRWTATDESDKFKGGASCPAPKLDTKGWTVVEVLTFLVGRPWNNAALNVVQSLRPSAIRVIEDGAGQTLDSYTWRVDIYLDSNGSTIRKITQAVEVGLIGCRYGEDVTSYIEGRVPAPRSAGVIFNPRGLKKLTLTSEPDKT